jgi:hypothetical protein
MHRSIAIILLDVVVQINADVAPQAAAAGANRTQEEFVDKFDQMLDKLFQPQQGIPGDDKDGKELVDKIMGKLFTGLGEKSDHAAQAAKGSTEKEQGLDGKEFMDKFIEKLFTKEQKADAAAADSKDSNKGLDDLLKLFAPANKTHENGAADSKGLDDLLKLFAPTDKLPHENGAADSKDSKKGLDDLLKLFAPAETKPGEKGGLDDNWLNKLLDPKNEGKDDPLSKLLKGDGNDDPLSKLLKGMGDGKGDAKDDALSNLFTHHKSDGKEDPLSKLLGGNTDGKEDPLSKLLGGNTDLSNLLGGKADLNKLLGGKDGLNDLLGGKDDPLQGLNKLFDHHNAGARANDDPLSSLPSLQDRWAPRRGGDGVSRRRAPGHRESLREEVEEEAAPVASSLRGQVESFSNAFPSLVIPMPLAILIGLLAGSSLTFIMTQVQRRGMKTAKSL